MSWQGGHYITIEVFADESEKLEIDVFSAAVDFELLKDSLEEAEQFAKDYVDCEEKEYRRMIDEFNEHWPVEIIFNRNGHNLSRFRYASIWYQQDILVQ